MRSVILSAGISLDGYIARPDDSVDFLFMPEDYSMAPFFSTVDTTVMGRKSYEVGLKLGGGPSMPGCTSYVFSRLQPPGERDGVHFVNEPPEVVIGEIRSRPGKDIWLMGGGELTRAFLEADLVDGLYLGVVPVLIGSGIPLFPSGFPQRDFELVETASFSLGLVTLRYQIKR